MTVAAPRTRRDDLEEAFYAAMRRWRTQRDDDPNRLETDALVDTVFAEHELVVIRADYLEELESEANGPEAPAPSELAALRLAQGPLRAALADALYESGFTIGTEPVRHEDMDRLMAALQASASEATPLLGSDSPPSGEAIELLRELVEWGEGYEGQGCLWCLFSKGHGDGCSVRAARSFLQDFALPASSEYAT